MTTRAPAVLKTGNAGCLKVVSKLSASSLKVDPNLSPSSLKVDPKLSPSSLKVDPKLSQSRPVVSRLSQSCPKVFLR